MDDIKYIHSNKLAVPNKKYYGSDKRVYTGLSNGRLKLEETVDLTDIEKSIETLKNTEPVEYTAGSNIDITDNEISYSGPTPVSINVIMAHIAS